MAYLALTGQTPTSRNPIGWKSQFLKTFSFITEALEMSSGRSATKEGFFSEIVHFIIHPPVNSDAYMVDSDGNMVDFDVLGKTVDLLTVIIKNLLCCF